MPNHRTRPGKPAPLGAHWDGHGTNFSLYSETASSAELCLVEADGAETRLPMGQRTDYAFHLYVEGVGPGQRYGYRVDGPWEPQAGLRFHREHRLLDPYARALAEREDWSRGAFTYDQNAADNQDLVKSPLTNQLAAPLGLVIDDRFDWGDDRLPDTALRRSVIYEAHVRGLTQTHPEVPDALRGTYLGVASAPIVRHLQALGVTAIELLPVHGFVDDQALLDRGLRNYWGYNTLAFFAPDPRYRSGTEPGAEVRQFKEMVKALHQAGIEVVLDVVYNHTAEGNQLGPTLSFKGIDNPTYYRLGAEDRRYYADFTGTGNTLNVFHPQTLTLVMDSLRYWAGEMHVDGFRFDLASTLARGQNDVDQHSSFFAAVRQDPLISRRKLIAEPWDVGNGGYLVGHFPLHWAEWNGRYRDTVRGLWRGDPGQSAELGYRLTGSADLYRDDGRSPSSSINFITAHDGFTLRDLVSYDHKHNEANGEGNRDGTDDNRSWNCGTEGETEDQAIQALRRRQTRNLLATLMLSQGTPMICAGDELGRTQAGNNNAYCQDTALAWLDWSFVGKPGDARARLLGFANGLGQLRRAHPLIQRANFFSGQDVQGVGVNDLVWFRHDGQAMTPEDWSNPGTASLGMFMSGAGLDGFDEDGQPQTDDDLLLLVNASTSDLEVTVPRVVETGGGWKLLLDTAFEPPADTALDNFPLAAPEQVYPEGRTPLPARSLRLFGRRPATGAAK